MKTPYTFSFFKKKTRPYKMTRTAPSIAILSIFALAIIASMIPVARALTQQLMASNRAEVLNLLNHPLQLQLATGDLPLESFRRLVEDRRAILEGLEAAIGNPDITRGELDFHEEASRRWLRTAEDTGRQPEDDDSSSPDDKSGITLECADDSGVSQTAQALASILRANGIVGAAAVLRCYSFACDRLLVARAAAAASDNPSSVYDGWLEVHAGRWSELADRCEKSLRDAQTPTASEEASFSLCLSMLYNWIDGEAATTGVRGDLRDPRLSRLMDELEGLEPGYAAQRDKNASFVADITGTASTQRRRDRAEQKAAAAAAYLAAKATKSAAAQKAEAYLAAKKKKEQES